MALIAFGVGSIVRHTAGAIAIVVALMFIIPLLENTLPSNWHDDIMRFLPDAANQVVSVTIAGNTPGHLWSAWPQLGVTALWAAALVAIGAYLFRTRDAYLPAPPRPTPPPPAPTHPATRPRHLIIRDNSKK